MSRYAIPSADCTVDLIARECRRNGVLQPLSPKVFDGLAYLITHRERAIGRDELIAAVWGKADVSDDLLGQLVVKIRRTVGDSGGEQALVRTIPGFGYRWVGAIEPLSADAPPLAASAPAPASTPASTPEPSSAPALPSPAVSPRRHLRLAAAGLLLAIAGVAAVAVWKPGAPGPVRDAAPAASAPQPLPTADALAVVLPVAVNADGDWDWLRLGMMDLIAGKLRRGGLRVVSSDAVVSLSRIRPDDLPQAAHLATGAQLVFTPEAERQGGAWNVRLTVSAADGRRLFQAAAGDGDVTTAAYQAVQQALVRLGRGPIADAVDPASGMPVHERLSRIESAMLADDLATAQRLIDATPPALMESPEIRLRLADIDERLGRYGEAHQRLERLAAEVPAERDPVLRAQILYRYGIVAVRLDHPDEALQHFAEGLPLLDGRNQPGISGKLLAGRGIAHALQGKYDQTEADFSKARVAYELAGDLFSLAALESNVGNLEILRHRPANALSALDQAIGRMQSIRTFNGLPQAYAAKVQAQLLLLSPADALATAEEFAVRYPDAPDVPARIGLDMITAYALAANGKMDRAQALLGRLEADPRVLASGDLQGRVQTMQAQMQRETGDPARAVRLAQAALARFTQADDSGPRSNAWQEHVDALLALGRIEEARVQAEAFADWADAGGDDRARIKAWLVLAQAADAAGQAESAASWFDKALQLALQLGVPAYTAEAALTYANALLDHDRTGPATEIASRVFPWADRDFDCALLKLRLYHRLAQADGWRKALIQAQALAGERPIPSPLAVSPDAVKPPAPR